MKKRFLAALLVLCMVIALLPTVALAVDEQPAELSSYKVIAAGISTTLPEGFPTENAGSGVSATGQNRLFVQLNKPVPTGYTIALTVYPANKQEGAIFSSYVSGNGSAGLCTTIAKVNNWYWGETAAAGATDLSKFGDPAKLYFHVSIVKQGQDGGVPAYSDPESTGKYVFTPANSITKDGGVETTATLIEVDTKNPYIAKPEAGNPISDVELCIVKDKATYDAVAANHSAWATANPWDDSRPEDVVIADTDFPWLVVFYNRASAGEVTFSAKLGDTEVPVTGGTFTAAAENDEAYFSIALTKFTNANDETSTEYIYETKEATKYGSFSIGVKLGDNDVVWSNAAEISAPVETPIAIAAAGFAWDYEDANTSATTVLGKPVTDSIDQTMWVKLNKAIGMNKLWLKVTDASGKELISEALSDGTEASTMAGFRLSFLHKGQNSEDAILTPGTYTVGLYEYTDAENISETAVSTKTVTIAKDTRTVSASVSGDKTSITLKVDGDKELFGRYVIELVKDGTTEPVAIYLTEADAGATPDKPDNAKPFAEYAFNKAEGFEPGNYTINVYARSAKASDDEKIGTPLYTAKAVVPNLATGEEKAADVTVPDAVKDVIAELPPEEKAIADTIETVTAAAGGIKVADGSSLNSDSVNQTMNAAVEKHNDAQTAIADAMEENENADIKVVSYLAVEVKEYAPATSDGGRKLTLDITPMWKLQIDDVDATNTDGEVISGEIGNAAAYEPVVIEIAIPTGFAAQGETVYVEHKGYVYTAEVDAGKISFTNPHGFSDFVLYATSPIKATITNDDGSTNYTSLQGAVSAAKNGDVITLTNGYDASEETITLPAGVMIFTIAPEAGHPEYLPELKAPSGYNYTTAESGDNLIVAVSKASTGGGGVSQPTYTVTVPAVENGKVTVNPMSGAAGTLVTVNATPDEGYEIDSVVVTDANGNAVTTTNTNGTYAFAMPAANVTVKVTFKAKGTTPVQLPFTDVKADDWFIINGAVEYVYTNALFNGTTATTFGPNVQMQRCMMVEVLYRLAGKPEVTGENKFSDVADDAYFKDAVIWASENSIVTGYDDGTFKPYNNVKRSEMVAFIYRYAKAAEIDVTATDDLSAFTDAASVPDWALEAMQWAVGAKIVNGVTATTIAPSNTSTRAQVATVLLNLSSID